MVLLSEKGCFHHINEPEHSKTFKMTYVPSENSDQPAHLPSDQSLCWALCG